MSQYGAFSDDFYVNMNLTTEMEIPQGAESLLHFFEQVRRRFPRMENFYSRENSEFVLEEEKEAGAYRWISCEPKRVNSGVVNPDSMESAADQHRTILEMVPYELSISQLNCESISVMLGFDMAYRGNHNEILAEVIGVPPGLEALRQVPFGRLLSHEPVLQFALDEDCRTQCRVSFESRTSPYQVRSGEFGDEQLSVYLTVRRFSALAMDETYVSEFDRLTSLSQDLVDEYLIPRVLRPLKEAISQP